MAAIGANLMDSTRRRHVLETSLRTSSAAWRASDEVPAILQRGERVMSRREVAAGGGGVNVTIQTPDPRSFQSSRAQIAADLARAVGAGRRGI